MDIDNLISNWWLAVGHNNKKWLWDDKQFPNLWPRDLKGNCTNEIDKVIIILICDMQLLISYEQQQNSFYSFILIDATESKGAATFHDRELQLPVTAIFLFLSIPLCTVG